MKQGLNLNLSQSLTLTPQLQQAIRLLQLSTLDLQQEIQLTLESNPLLEVDENNVIASDEKQDDADQTASDVALNNSELPKESPVDTAWEDIYPTQGSKIKTKDDGFNFENVHHASVSLQEHLIWQMDLTPFTDTDKAIATTIIDSINDDGLLTTPVEDILESLGPHNPENPIEVNEIIAVLHRIQRFDPVGVGARDLSECLYVQLQQYDKTTKWLEEAKTLVLDHLELIGSNQQTQLLRKLKVTKEELKEILRLIQSLHPKPGNLILDHTSEYITPDVIVRKEKGRWKVELNQDSIPPLKVNAFYASMIQRANNSPDNVFLKSHLQEAKWFIKSLQSRHETLLKVASAIVIRQQDFLEHGDEAMKPLILADIANTLEMHESTISRVTTQKFMHTPRGVFELKYFFSSHVSTTSGGEASATAIRAVIKKLIAAENSAKPLSDKKIAELLGAKGIKIARRTIAKYREAIGIPPSNERKSIFSD